MSSPERAAQVLIAGTIVHAAEELQQMLGPVAQIHQLESASREEFLRDVAPGGRYAGVTHIYRHNDSASRVGLFDARLIDSLPSTTVAVCHNGAGYDQIDVGAAKRRGIWVSHTPKAVDDATADVALFLLLSAMRRFSAAERNARCGRWKQGLAPAHDPEGKVLGVVGMGGIGMALANRASAAFGMRVLYHNRRPHPDAPAHFAYVADLDEMLSQCDAVSLHLPLNEATRGSFGGKQLARMRRGAVLVNTARGGVVDQEALIESLRSGHLGGAGLDVFPDEPNIDARLLEFDNVTLLPHMGTETVETQKRMEVQVLGSILASIQGGATETTDTTTRAGGGGGGGAGGKGAARFGPPTYLCKEFGA